MKSSETWKPSMAMTDSTTKKGQRCPRDLVQFVPFKKFQNNYAQLSREVLAEIPDQLVDYMKLVGMKPSKPQQVDISQMVPRTQTLQFQGNVVQPQQLPVIQPQQQFQGNVSMPVQMGVGGNPQLLVSVPVVGQNVNLAPVMNPNVYAGGPQYPDLNPIQQQQQQDVNMQLEQVGYMPNSVSFNVNFDEQNQQKQMQGHPDPNQVYSNISMVNSQMVNYPNFHPGNK